MQALMSPVSKLDNGEYESGKRAQPGGFPPGVWRHLSELLLSGGLTSVVTHFLRAALSSDTVRSAVISYLKLERNAMLYFNCRSTWVHNNVKILAKCLIMSLGEALGLLKYTNWACQGNLRKLTEHMSSDKWWSQTTSHSNKLDSQKTLWVRWLELFLYANSLNLYFSVALCSSCPLLALSHIMTCSMAWVTSQFLQQHQTMSMTFWVYFY